MRRALSTAPVHREAGDLGSDLGQIGLRSFSLTEEWAVIILRSGGVSSQESSER